MYSGADLMRGLDEGLTQLRGDEQRLGGISSQLEADLARLRQQQVAVFRTLAGFRLDALRRTPLVEALDHADRRALAALEALDSQRHRLTQALEAAEAAEAQATAVVATESARVDEAQAALTALESQEEQRLSTDPAWMALAEEVLRLEDIAEEAQDKAAQAAQDLGSKQAPYDADRLFRYLWDRHWGTGAYAGGRLAKLGDGWLARRIRYDDNRANYGMLQEIPARLAAHAAQQEARAAEARAALAEKERTALEAAGIGPLEAALAQAMASLEAADAHLSRASAATMAAEAALAQFLEVGAADQERAALAALADHLSRSDLQALAAAARQTPDPQDDHLVAQGEDLARRITRTEQELADTRTQMRDAARRRLEMEEARSRALRQGYHHRHNQYSQGNEVMKLIAGLLIGAASAVDLEDLLRSSRRRPQRRSHPGFGGGLGGGGFGGGPMTSGSFGGGVAGGDFARGLDLDSIFDAAAGGPPPASKSGTRRFPRQSRPPPLFPSSAGGGRRGGGGKGSGKAGGFKTIDGF